MTILDTLITDRAETDVEWARTAESRGWGNLTPAEREALKSGMKGLYAPTDLNRIVSAMEYIDRLMTNAKRESVYVPTIIAHAEYTGTWNRWSDTVWVDSDYLAPELWVANLANINRLWEAARRFEAVVLARYDPDGSGYIKPGVAVDAGELFQVTDSVGLLELRVTAACPPAVTAEGIAWTVAPTADGWAAVLDYTDCPYPDIDDALAALNISCGADSAADGLFTLSASLRYDCEVAVGTCAVQWSPFITWGAARTRHGSWGGAKPFTWGQTAKGGTV